jgi:hypothetical protein
VLKATVAEGAEQFDILERVGDQNMAEYAATCAIAVTAENWAKNRI